VNGVVPPMLDGPIPQYAQFVLLMFGGFVGLLAEALVPQLLWIGRGIRWIVMGSESSLSSQRVRMAIEPSHNSESRVLSTPAAFRNPVGAIVIWTMHKSDLKGKALTKLVRSTVTPLRASAVLCLPDQRGHGA
jgi:hypothetical protein